MPVIHFLWALLTGVLMNSGYHQADNTLTIVNSALISTPPAPLACNCTITQDGNSYPISALMGIESAPLFYDYGIPNASSANTGLELSNGLILFLYEEISTGVISLFLIADIANSGTGGSLSFDINCVPAGAFISVQDEPGEFSGAPPLISGNWSWVGCCTDGGVIENLGCNNTVNLDLLISSGIDSIVWLTGDIANPDQILLNLTGEAITIQCGTGGVCCPVEFDTEIVVMDAGCPDTPDGMISLNPQDGVPPYMYNWSNGATTAINNNLIPGIYTVTVTDAQSCSEELQITVSYMLDYPVAQSTSIELCSENTTDIFDLTAVEDVVNDGTGYSVLWFQNADLTGNISNPSNYLSGTAIIYAVVDNGSCISEPVPVNLEIHIIPLSYPSSMNVCEEDNGMATFDLTTLDATVSGGNGNVLWFLNAGLTNPISDPSSFYSASTTIYAAVEDGSCISEPAMIDLIVDLKPTGDPTDAHLCGDEDNEAIFDLTLLESSISGGSGSIEWYLEIELLDLISSPSAFQTTTTTVYAVLFDDVCYSDAIPVDLIVDMTPIGNPVNATMCDDGSGQAIFNLLDYNAQVSGGVGGVDWFWDPLFTDPIPNPQTLLTETTVVFALIDNGTCISEPVPVDLTVIDSPLGNATFLETCADSSGQGTFNLTVADTIVSGGIGIIQWFEDPLGNLAINNPTAFMSTGSTVFAQINNGVCLSDFVPVDLIITNSVSAMPVQYFVCDHGTNSETIELLPIASLVNGGSGQVNWFLDSTGLVPYPLPEIVIGSNTTIYASVTAGNCISGIVPVELIILQSPYAINMVFNLCSDTSGQVTIDLTSLDTLISGNTGNVSWYIDSALTISITNPVSFNPGDTLLYAAASNGICTSPPAEILFNVSQELSANPLLIELCKPQGDTLLIDLTQSDIDIGGINQVYWFMDSLGTMGIQNPDSFPGSASQTLYAHVTDSICTSALVPIELMILDQPVANAFLIKKCGDTNGQIIFDLTSIDSIVSGNTGVVTWYADDTQTIEISTPASFMSGDTILYAIVTNGFCVSPSAPVTLDIVDSLTANPTRVQVCVMDTNTAIIDLTQFDFVISGGNGTVIWFSDDMGIDTITDPTAFITSGDTLFAMIEADGCTSGLTMIPIEVASSSLPLPVCEFSSIDSLMISWSSVAKDYELSYAVNGTIIGSPFITQSNEFSLGGFLPGDTLTLWVTALFDSICTTPMTNTITCITDICPPQMLSFPGLQSAYCRDESPIFIDALPSGGQLSGQGISGSTFFPNLVSGNSTVLFYTWEDITTGCQYDLSAAVQIIDPPLTPALTCQSSSLNSVTFSWNTDEVEFGYEYVINLGGGSGVVLTGDSVLVINGLNEGDEVAISLWSVGMSLCGNSDTVTMSCFAQQCPQVDFVFDDSGILCTGDDPFMLDVIVNGFPGVPEIVWSGPAIIDPTGLFDPAKGMMGHSDVTVHIDESGCVYDSTFVLIVLDNPIASFIVDGVPCLDDTLQVLFNGMAYGSSQWNWDFSGANVEPTSFPPWIDFLVNWDEPGDYEISLWIDYHGCISDTFVMPVQIDSPLSPFEIHCEEENYYSLVVSWDPVAGANEYIVNSTLGDGKLLGTKYEISNLPDDTPVSITVTAIGPTACGPVSSTIECRTPDYIAPAIFIPNIFSPDHDGINDVFFIQSNSQIATVHAFRIFDRWGNLIFEQLQFNSNDTHYGWDGTFSGKDMNPGVYLYWAEIERKDGVVEVMAGDLTLIR